MQKQKRKLQTILTAIVLVAAAAIGGLWGGGHAYEIDTRNRFGLDDELYALWLRADKHYSQHVALEMADTMIALSKKKGCLIGECLALEIPVDYYNSQRYIDIDSLRKAVIRQRDFAFHVPDGQDFAFRGWAKLIARYLKQYDYENTLAELKQFAEMARRTGNEYGQTRTFLLYARVYSSMGRDSLALSYMKDGIRFVESHGRNELIYDLYSDITEMLIKTGQADSAMYYINRVEGDPNATNAALLRALYQKSAVLDARGDYDELYNTIQSFRERLKYQRYSHSYYADMLHWMQAVYLTARGDTNGAVAETESIGDDVEKINSQIKIAEMAGLWKTAYLLQVKLDSLNRANNTRQMSLFAQQQDSILKASATEKARQQLETENLRMKTEQLELERKNNDIKRERLRVEKELDLQMLRQARLAAQKDSLRALEQAAKVRKQAAELEEREAKQNARKSADEKQLSLLRLIIAVLAALAMGAIVYIRYRRLYLKALNAEYEAAVETDREKTDVIHNIRHEIRTPLNSIVGFTDLLSMADEMELTEEERQQYIVYIMQNTQQLQTIIDNMTSLSRMKREEIELRIKTADVAPIVAEAIDNMAGMLPAGVEMLNEIAEQKVELQTDRKLLLQVWENLISNACKYTQHGSIRLTCADRGDTWEFAVADTGKGIPEDKAEAVFDRFEKLGSLVQGAGLGLNFCRAVIEKLGGHIKVDTTYTGGCRMVFTHPKPTDIGGGGKSVKW